MSSSLREGEAQGVFTRQLFQTSQVRVGVEEPQGAPGSPRVATGQQLRFANQTHD